MFGNRIDVQDAREFTKFCLYQLVSAALGLAFAYYMVGVTLA